MYNKNKFIEFCVFITLSISLPFCAQAGKRDLLKLLYLKQLPESKPKKEGDFTLGAEFGFLYANGNTNTSSFKAAFSSDHELENWSNRYFAEIIYKENKANKGASSQVSAQRILTFVQLDYKLNTSKNRLFLYGEYDDDRFNGFRYQASVAAGWSSVGWKEPSSEFRYSIGPGFSYSQRALAPDAADKKYVTEDEMILRASLDYRLSISKTSKFRHFMSTETGEENNRSRSETSLSANLYKSLAMKLSFVMLYNEGVNKRRENLSTETSVSLVYQFF